MFDDEESISGIVTRGWAWGKNSSEEWEHSQVKLAYDQGFKVTILAKEKLAEEFASPDSVLMLRAIIKTSAQLQPLPITSKKQ